jgi:hypothetical protein
MLLLPNPQNSTFAATNYAMTPPVVQPQPQNRVLASTKNDSGCPWQEIAKEEGDKQIKNENALLSLLLYLQA